MKFDTYNLYIWLFRSSTNGNELFKVVKHDISFTNICKTIRFYKKHYKIQEVIIRSSHE